MQWIKDGTLFVNPLHLGGQLIYNPTESQLREAGYTPYTPPAPTPASVFTKRQIRLACRALSYETKLDTILASSETLARDWNEAQDIDFSNEQTEQAIEQAISAGLFTRAEISALLAKLRETYPNGTSDEV